MNIFKIKELAIRLEQELIAHSKIDPESIGLHSDLKPLLEAAKAEKILAPLETRDVPGRYRFTERNLQQYEELEDAFAKFAIEVTGGEPPALKLFRESRK